MKSKQVILAVIVFAQFFCTSLWFATNAIGLDLMLEFNLDSKSVGNLTSAVQLGFIFGTLVFAILNIADRFSPSKVFFMCAAIGAVLNLFTLLPDQKLISLIAIRTGVGFCLAGIYPVGMKIASDYFDKGLGKSLGYLIGALVLGTALPHLLAVFNYALNWQTIILSTSALAFLGGLSIMIFVPDGPYRKASQKMDLKGSFRIFRNRNFRKAAFGYFGHMWELYAFWAFVPFIISFNPILKANASLFSFYIIAIGSISCFVAGKLSVRFSSRTLAIVSLGLSGIACVLSPLFIANSSPSILLIFLLFWGAVVVSDSPMFSSIVAENAPIELKATGLTIVNSIGFALTILSIELLNYLIENIPIQYIFMPLAIGPAFGLIAMIKRI